MSGDITETRLRELRNRWWFPDHLHIRPLWRDLRAVAQYASGRLLDLGCGNAPYRPWFEPRTTGYVTADYPPLACGVQVGCDSAKLPFQAGAFDTVLCTQVLEHTPRPWLVSAEIARVLRAGGVLILSCPQYWPLHELPHDYYRFTPKGLEVLFPKTDWEWLEHRQQGSTWAVIACALWQSFRAFGKPQKIVSLICNPLFLLLDRCWRSEKDTTNHVIVLRKKNAAPVALR